MDRAVFKWLSKVITWLRLLSLVIGSKDSRQLFNQWEAKSNRTMYAWFFPRFERVTSNCYELWLVHRAVCSCCDWSENLLWFWFSDIHFKTALTQWVLIVLIRWIVIYPLDNTIQPLNYWGHCDSHSSRSNNASVNSKCALPPPPRADPREFAFFFLCMANSRGRGRSSCQMPGGRDESRRQMPRYT